MTWPRFASPTVYVIAGPNGAGKTTFATEFLPEFVQCREFVNADLIAAGLSPFAPETQAMRAGRLVLVRIKELAEARQDFAFETTLAGRSYVKLISGLRQSGYNIVLFFLWLPSAEEAVRGWPTVSARVATTFRRQPYAVDSRQDYTTFFDCTRRSSIRGTFQTAAACRRRSIASRSDSALQTYQL